MRLLLGATGRLGRAMIAEFGRGTVLAPPRAVYENWWREESIAEIRNWLGAQDAKIDMVVVAAGVIDPRASALDHDRVNRLLAQQVILAATPMGIRVVTFGTMMEAIAVQPASTGYVASKAALAEFVRAQSLKHDRSLHLRIHTLYGGGEPDPFMFTGQMLSALKESRPFLMSPGTQLREYHHVDDEARAISTLIDSDMSGVVQLNHGDPVALAELAIETFSALGAVDLLRVGALPGPVHELPDLRFERTPALMHHSFRNVRTAMPEYLRGFLPDRKQFQ